MATALWANAALLAVILVVLLTRNGAPSLLPSAYAQQQQNANIAGGGGVYIMPAQLAQNQWGCYLLDIDSQDLVAYLYSPADRKLRFVAARNYKYDRRLSNYSTEPAPKDVQKLLELEGMTRKTEEPPAKSPEVAPNEPRQ
jgi:hypothetical protein